MNVFQELKRRNFLYQATDEAAIEKKLSTEKVVYYAGFDPTGSSLHVGHLLPVMAMRLLQKAGHVPIVLVGGATAQIGDPSGRSSARVMLTKEMVAENAASLKHQLSRFLSLEEGKSHFVDNNDWFKELMLLDFLRDIGSRFSVNRMLAQESVKQRLENGLSYLEFTYSLLQGYDFLHLHRAYNCTLEIGGQDQWGNMVAGTELIRRMSGESSPEVHCLTIPLLMNPATGQKFGKSIGGASVWLDPERTNVFDYYQFWRNCDDGMIADLLKKFALDLPVEEAEALAACGNINRAKEILAYEATKLAHGEAEAAKAFAAAGSKFGFADPQKLIPTTSTILKVDVAAVAEVPSAVCLRSQLENGGLRVANLMVDAALAGSTSEARRLIQGGAVSLGDRKICDPSAVLKPEDFPGGEAMLRAGKKKFKKIIVQ
ncbi:MAG: tyrosine--tRNA ligase [Victivallaceae bacterium]|nr:tyrosine--tRNA ligase [Victivallaceae bacterium]